MFHDKVLPYLSGENRAGGLLANPMFNAGMGLLSSRMDNNINPFLAGMQGLANAKSQETTAEDRDRLAKLREELSALIAQQGMQPGGGMGQPNPFSIGAEAQGMQPSPFSMFAGAQGGPPAGGGGQPMGALGQPMGGLGQQQQQPNPFSMFAGPQG